MDKRTPSLARTGAVLLLLLGCVIVLHPFLAAVLFAAAVCISTWPLYTRLLARLRGRATLAALCMTFSLSFVILLPLAVVAWSLADDVASTYEHLKTAIETGTIAPPPWIRDLPLVGESFDAYLRKIFSSREELTALGRRMLDPARHYLAVAAMVLGAGVAQVALAAFVSFFLYRDGEAIATALRVAGRRLIGPSSPQIAEVVVRTVRGVMYGLLGTALAQALVAAIGLAIAGVPGVPLLAVATFVLSLVPIGPPLVWGGAAAWLFSQGEPGWAVFMLVWGFFGISGVDNVVKPMLISRGSDLPFLLVLLGVMGGVLAFGFVGLFLGPALLAVGFSLMRDWTRVRPEGPPI